MSHNHDVHIELAATIEAVEPDRAGPEQRQPGTPSERPDGPKTQVGMLALFKAFAKEHWKPILLSILAALIPILGYSSEHLYLNGFGINYADYAQWSDLLFDALGAFGLLILTAVILALIAIAVAFVLVILAALVYGIAYLSVRIGLLLIDARMNWMKRSAPPSRNPAFERQLQELGTKRADVERLVARLVARREQARQWSHDHVPSLFVVGASTLSCTLLVFIFGVLYSRYHFSHDTRSEVEACMAYASNSHQETSPSCGWYYKLQIRTGLLPVPRPVAHVEGSPALQRMLMASSTDKMTPPYYIGRHNGFLFFAYGEERLDSSVIIGAGEISQVAFGTVQPVKIPPTDPPLPPPPPPPPPECDREDSCLAAQLAALQQGQATNAGAINDLRTMIDQWMNKPPPALPTSIQLDLRLPREGIPIKFDDLAIKWDESSTQGIQAALTTALDHVRETLNQTNRFQLAMRKCDAMMPMVAIRGDHHRGNLVSCYDRILNPKDPEQTREVHVSAAVTSGRAR